MRRADDTPMDPELADWLESIDATLAGEPVSPRYAESSELALLLSTERPSPGDAFTRELDARVARRFARAPGPSGPVGPADKMPRRSRGYLLGGLVSVCAAAAVAVVLVIPGTRSPRLSPYGAGRAPGGASGSSGAVKSLGPTTGSTGGSATSSPTRSAASSAGTASTPTSVSAVPPQAATTGAASLSLPPNGRKVVQSSQIDLGADPNHIDAVAQEVFDAVGADNGIVDRSTVTQTGGLDGYASFSLRLPSASVGQELNRLSALPNAQVLSRTDSSQDVNGEYVSATRALSEAQALRTSLLRQLANATTTTASDNLKARIHDADAAIASDQAAVNRLNSRINYTQVAVTISARPAPAPVHHGGGPFSLGEAGHIAGRVIVVAAGVALITLAALIPAALLFGLLAWIAAALRRRRREQALDTA